MYTFKQAPRFTGTRTRFSAIAPTTVLIAAAAPVLAQECILSTTAPDFGDNQQSGLHSVPHSAETAPHTDFHGQLLIGQDSLYLYHLPLFMEDTDSHPHNFQVVLEVALPLGDDSIMSEDQASNPGSVYSATPVPFDQSSLVLDYPGHASLRSLPASIFRGHFEREPNEMIIEDTTIDIGNVVHFREFVAGGPKLDPLSYVLFGRDGETFMVHLLSAPPDFDQVVSVTIGDPGLSGGLLRGGLYVSLPGRANNPSERLQIEEFMKCQLEASEDAAALEIDVTVIAELYCEAGEVGQVDFAPSRPCP